jgi:hypothetical protein
MAGTIVITCPDCEKQTKVPDNLAGKKVRCKGCGGVIPVPQKRTIDTRMATPEVKKKLRPSEEEDASKPYGVEEISVAPRCPHCAYEMEPPDAVICLHCGYNMTKRRRVESRKVYEYSSNDWMLWLGPGVACAIAFFGLIGFCVFFHFWLPGLLMTKWDGLAEKGLNRFEIVDQASDESYLAYLFHPGIETWIIVICIWLMWKSGKFAYKRLIVNYMPPEVVVGEELE